MPVFRLQFRPELGRLDETLPADRLAEHGEFVVLSSTVWIGGEPRETIVRRVTRRELVRITTSQQVPSAPRGHRTGSRSNH